MPKLFSLLLLMGSFFVQNSFAQESSEYASVNSSTFTLKIEGLKEAKGEVRIAMFNSSEKYTKEPVYAVVLPVGEDIVEWKVPDLPFGEYAIAVYHDKNINGKLDTNFLGIPKESYGFSNNARGRFGPAKWKDAKFVVNNSTLVHKIEIK